MISELLGEAVGIIGNGERIKHSINGVLGSSSSSSSPSISPALSPSLSPSSSTVTTPTSSSTSSASENLRCPRCDSTNTKFCYYNNYNLTQPRHFCKTCRRYWTKGGALRNVPIGGGCRKNKSTTIASTAHVIKSAAAGKFRVMASEMGKSGFISNFEQGFSSSASNANPILWASPDQNSHMLSLLRVNQNPNPNSGPVSSSSAVVVKEEVSMAGSHVNSSQSPVVASGALMNARILGLNPSAGRVLTSFGISTTTSSLRRDNECQNIGFILGEAQGTGGVHEFYQRLRSPEANYCPGAVNEAVVPGNINNVCSSSSSSSSCLTILESAPVVAAADQLGCWNPILSWSDLPTTHGAYP